ncbi:hypothetical protein LTR22_028190 [Elasticomyces elasticus]|nr:hypothetical protein LTR22_028190 [Elasticomyces elasticus]
MDAEVQRLKRDLAERGRTLEEQAANLAELERSVTEVSSLLPTDGYAGGGNKRKAPRSEDNDDGQEGAQLRQLLGEKNENISLITQEFDTHRADFRSTLDSLEMASTETERLVQNEALQEEVAADGDRSADRENFEGIVSELKRLEELVAELEEGLEESRRGEAEAGGEVEFLRGELERGRSELKREKEKAAAVLARATAGVRRLARRRTMRLEVSKPSFTA